MWGIQAASYLVTMMTADGNLVQIQIMVLLLVPQNMMVTLYQYSIIVCAQNMMKAAYFCWGYSVKIKLQLNCWFVPPSYFQESSCQYWPSAVGELIEFEEYTVDLISEEALQGFTIRILSVLHNKVYMKVAADLLQPHPLLSTTQ